MKEEEYIKEDHIANQPETISLKELEIINSSLIIFFDINQIIENYESNISLTKDENYYRIYEKVINKKIQHFNESENRQKWKWNGKCNQNQCFR